MIAVVHAFSRRNAGDSLLVDLTLQELERAGAPVRECCVFALDPDSFEDLPRVVGVPSEPWGRLRPSLLSAGVQLLESSAFWLSRGALTPGRVVETLASADGIVAVGGGYLRTPTVVNSFGVLLNHVPQLAIAAASDRPSIYLPQSIGPLRGPVGLLTRRLLREIDTLFVRDGRSVRELSDSRSVDRMPDLAVLALAARGIAPRGSEGRRRLLVVGRALGSDPGYAERLRELDRTLDAVEWPIQAAGLGRRSDVHFYERLGVTPSGELTRTLSEGHGVVVSVRLHGALQALLSGWPAIHLAYERKGWGAFEDLGLQEFVHPARSFEPSRVAEQARALLGDAGFYWNRIEETIPKLRAAGRTLRHRLREFVGRCGSESVR